MTKDELLEQYTMLIDCMRCCDNCAHWESPDCKKAKIVNKDNPRKIRACDEDSMRYWELREDFIKDEFKDLLEIRKI